MPRTPEENQHIKDARRTDILRAASRVFAKKGFAAAKINDIAHEAGLSHGLVYHYFRTKDDVFAAILEAKIENMRCAMQEDEAATGSAVERIRTSVGRWLQRTLEEPEMGLMIAQAMLSDSLSPAIREMLADHARESFGESVARIRLAQRRGEIGKHATADELASSLMCIMRGLALASVVHIGVPFTPPSVDTVMRLLTTPEEHPVAATTSKARATKKTAAKAKTPVAAKPTTANAAAKKDRAKPARASTKMPAGKAKKS